MQFEESSEGDDNEPLVKDHANQRDYNEIFPGVFKEAKDIVYGPSVAKLRGDDLFIVERLVNKYGDDLGAMARDIKINYMQWSKGELKKKTKAYAVHHLN